jgi:hypothetical protein
MGSGYSVGHFLLRAGIAFSFLYPPFAAVYDPIAWSGYFPDFVQSFPVNTMLLLHVFGALEVVIALWLLWGRRLTLPSIAATILLLAIVVTNMGDFAILFRDIALALAALSLAFLPEPSRV